MWTWFIATHAAPNIQLYILWKKIRTQIELDDGTEVWVDGAPQFCDKEDVVKVETAEVDLDSLCADISQAIDSGWIEIGLSANMKQRYAYYQTLQIYSNGQGVRTYALTGQQFPQGVTTEFTKLFQPSWRSVISF